MRHLPLPSFSKVYAGANTTTQGDTPVPSPMMLMETILPLDLWPVELEKIEEDAVVKNVSIEKHLLSREESRYVDWRKKRAREEILLFETEALVSNTSTVRGLDAWDGTRVLWVLAVPYCSHVLAYMSTAMRQLL